MNASHGKASHGRAKRLVRLRFPAMLRQIENQGLLRARPGILGISSSAFALGGHARPAGKIFYRRPGGRGPGVSGPPRSQFGGAHAHRFGFWPLGGRGKMWLVEGRAGVGCAGPGRGFGFEAIGAGEVWI